MSNGMRRLLAFVLACVMSFGVLPPMAVSAEELTEEALAATVEAQIDMVEEPTSEPTEVTAGSEEPTIVEETEGTQAEEATEATESTEATEVTEATEATEATVSEEELLPIGDDEEIPEGELYVTDYAAFLANLKVLEGYAEAFAASSSKYSDAGLLVVKEKASYGGYNDRMIDLRVDDDPEPIAKLAHLLDLHDLYFGATEVKVPVDEALGKEIQTALAAKGHYHGPIDGDYGEVSQRAFYDWCSMENFEERICEGKFMDEKILNILLGR